MPTNKYLRATQYLLISMHLAGVIGLIVPSSMPFFQKLVPFNLIITAIVLLLFQSKQRFFWGMAGGIALVGYLIEVIGVKTEQVFGAYQYGETLGFAVMGVPLLIGVNWLVLIIVSGSIIQHINNIWVKAAFGALLMVMLDYLIEPVAIAFDFWSWDKKEIPLQNYLAWGAVSFVLHWVFAKFDKGYNAIAKTIFYCQLFFFAILNIWLFFILK